jgi:hypothetical protein
MRTSRPWSDSGWSSAESGLSEPILTVDAEYVNEWKRKDMTEAQIQLPLAQSSDEDERRLCGYFWTAVLELTKALVYYQISAMGVPVLSRPDAGRDEVARELMATLRQHEGSWVFSGVRNIDSATQGLVASLGSVKQYFVIANKVAKAVFEKGESL